MAKRAKKVEKIEEGAVLWAEDECAPDAESIYAAWKRLFGEALNTENAVRVADYGDAMLYVKPLSGELLIYARRSLGVSREHMARALRVTPRDIIAWEEMDDFSKAPVQWLIDQLAATGVWG